MSKPSHNIALKKAAECRALILSTLPKLPSAIGKSDLYNTLAQHLPPSYSLQQFESVLYALVKNAQIRREGSAGSYLYTSKERSTAAVHKPALKKDVARLNITIGKDGDYVELTLRNIPIRISIGE